MGKIDYSFEPDDIQNINLIIWQVGHFLIRKKRKKL